MLRRRRIQLWVALTGEQTGELRTFEVARSVAANGEPRELRLLPGLLSESLATRNGDFSPTSLFRDCHEIANDFGILQPCGEPYAAVRKREIAVRKVVLVAHFDVAGANVLRNRPRVRRRNSRKLFRKPWLRALSWRSTDSGAVRANRILRVGGLIASLADPFRRRGFRGDSVGLCHLKRRVLKFLARFGRMFLARHLGFSPIAESREIGLPRPRTHYPQWRLAHLAALILRHLATSAGALALEVSG